MYMQRVLGEKINVSIPTAIPLEEKIVSDMDKPNRIYFNLRTLFRNFYTSWSNKDRPPMNAVIQDFRDELDTIKAICQNQRIESTFYVPTYKDLDKAFPHAKHTSPKTEGQQIYQKAEQEVVNVIAEERGIKVSKYFNPLPGTASWVLTAAPLDLLTPSKAIRLTLLESHTGKLKSNHEWMSKLTKDDIAQHFPFNFFTLQVFGDKSVLFHSQSPKLKRAVVDVGIKRGWTIMTTITTINRDLRTIPDEAIREQALKLASSIVKSY